ncbi:uncharacterized protein LOC105837798 [Monomorium pharaonis]|uniref:uncharacterized protein LOC105837798 n=1 Tax=Monomorium pharaonis TaxID=307658 RepID=UPI00063F2A67|nr:uncharacterized protein LOC105837798 [Monomorium pharaonis]
MSSSRVNVSYHNMRIFIIAILVVTLCYPAFIDTAVVHRSEKQLQRVLLRDSNARIPRAAEDNRKDAPTRICHNAPCGWAVYDTDSRNIEYFMKNTCVCLDESYKCVRAGDDLSASAYVYRCRQNTTADNIEAPKQTTI